jgi:hypothetical protein
MEDPIKPVEKKKVPCCCAVLLGVLVIVFAWWKVSWGGIALTILGVLMILREIAGQCCCADKTICPPKS